MFLRKAPKLSSNSRAALAAKYSGRKLDKSEEEEQKAVYDRIGSGELYTDEDDDRACEPDSELEDQVIILRRRRPLP